MASSSDSPASSMNAAQVDEAGGVRAGRALAHGDAAVGVADDDRGLADLLERGADRRGIVGEAGGAVVARQVDRGHGDAARARRSTTSS